MNTNRSGIDTQVCFQFYTGARLLQRMYRPYLDSWGITYAQYLVLSCLWERDGQSIVDMSEPLNLDSGTLSPLLRRLESAGLVTRSQDPDDFRKVYFHLTKPAKELAPKAEDMYRDVMASLGITEQDRRDLARISAKIGPSSSAQ